MTSVLLDRELIDEIRRIEHATGRADLLADFVRRLEDSITAFHPAFSASVQRGDAAGAARVAHTLKGASRQLGAQALGELFAEIEQSAKAGDYEAARSKFDSGAGLIAESLEALKRA